MAPATRETVFSQLNTRITEVSDRELPHHIAVRLAFLIGDAPVKYLDVPVLETPQGLTGAVIAYTDRVLIVAPFTGVPPHFMEDPYGGEVTPAMVSRTALTRVDVLPTQEPDRTRYRVWTDEQGGLLRWPSQATVRLTYASLDFPVELPRGRNREDFDNFLPTLLADLHPPSPSH
ncbi:hypothetical protein SAMN05660657_05058 [Geodermatophilus amargosae]|uniref:Uncharacterized protein n=1 Tax=Geodermatophilus amargosae TaxID=1296565 RepID=A0A1I7CYZ5_9ACTN|nr:hypothetical protein [Geodermatophilus amargosae]SFU04642.1 hypothetical protein SAMN05660657_05058 [Geodermatophilus amargosae]